MKGKKKARSVSVGLIILSLPAITSGDNVIYELKTQLEQKAEVIQAQKFNSEMFQDLVAKSGVVLTKDALSMMLDPAVSTDDIDAVTGPSMMHRQDK